MDEGNPVDERTLITNDYSYRTSSYKVIWADVRKWTDRTEKAYPVTSPRPARQVTTQRTGDPTMWAGKVPPTQGSTRSPSLRV